MRRMFACAMVCLFAAAPTGLAFGQAEVDGDDEGTPRIIYPERTNIDFPDALKIDGDLKGPRMQALFEPPEPVFTPLIKLRGHFNPEMVQSVNEL